MQTIARDPRRATDIFFGPQDAVIGLGPSGVLVLKLLLLLVSRQSPSGKLRLSHRDSSPRDASCCCIESLEFSCSILGGGRIGPIVSSFVDSRLMAFVLACVFFLGVDVERFSVVGH